MTPPTAINGTRRRAECPGCGRTFMVRADGLLRKHDALDWDEHLLAWITTPCEGSYIGCTGEGTAT